MHDKHICYVTENGLQLDFPTARVQWVHRPGSYYGFLRGLTQTNNKKKEEEEEGEEAECTSQTAGILLLEHKQMRDRT